MSPLSITKDARGFLFPAAQQPYIVGKQEPIIVSGFQYCGTRAVMLKGDTLAIVGSFLFPIEAKMALKAIETSYGDNLFRSRVEARWAVYWEKMKIAFHYEFEGYDLGAAGWYLPDFYLPQVDMWAEVKPTEFKPGELQKLQALVIFTEKPALMLIGPPECKAYQTICLDKHCQPNGLYLCEFILVNYHGRFYGDPYKGEIDSPTFDNVALAVRAAKSARFEKRERQYYHYNRHLPIAA